MTLSAGAGFVVAIAGSMMLMPGLGKVPQAQKLDVDDAGQRHRHGILTPGAGRDVIIAVGVRVEYLIKQYPLESGALEIQYIEEYFGEFPRRKTAREIIDRLADRESLILMAEAPLPDDPGALVPVSYKIVHEIRGTTKTDAEAARPGRAAARLRRLRRPPHPLFVDWRHPPRLARPGPFPRAHRRIGVWAMAAGFEEIVVKTKNRYYDMRAVLAQLQFNVVKYEPHEKDNAESKVYLGKPLPAELVRDHRSMRTVVHAV